MSTIANPSISTEISPLPRRRRPLARLRRWLRNGAVGVLALLGVGILVGQVQQFRLARAYPAVGEMIDVGGRLVHVIRDGEGPVVVFENGPGGMAVDWSLVAPAVAEFGQAFAYDRAGLGWSQPSGGPRDISRLVSELKETLEAAGAPAPYVLVGHSYGGLIVRAFAYEYPELGAGLVLVVAAHEDLLDIYPTEYAAKARSLAEQMGKLRGVYKLITASGIPALLDLPNPAEGHLPPALAAARQAATVMDSSHAVAATDEMAGLAASFEHVRRVRRPLGDLPVEIIAHGRPVGAEAGVPAGLEIAVEEAWQSMQRDLLAISSEAALEVARGSGHDIHLEAPQVVIDAIRRVVKG